MTDSLTVVNPESLVRLYGGIPPLEEFRLRSINLDWRGPTVTLRLDLSSFPGVAPPEWEGVDVDTVQCHLQFLAVADLSLTEWAPPACSSFRSTSLGKERRMRVRVTGAGVDLDFTSSQFTRVGHVSAFKITADGTDGSRHHFLQKLDSMRFETIPETDEKTFHGRL
ncbi:Imm50 family immunity protein [Streptomyces sp. NBC_00572]|uniref:Imm50 family immunity protein n=1 Tax=Streptomyces sp. NBC_00572 TaxID=2903664 RepID=UPI0022589BC9|nr:Imm50 family immunity protein [Streptomyces sp. NBC_00572]MCX4981971.1 immunity 50 family protein [Streptomyces sp. NBC_00572]